MNNRNHAEVLVLIACLLGVIGVVPFTAYRIVIGDYAMAALDATICLVSLSLFAFVWFTRNYKLVGTLMCSVYLISSIFAVHMKGVDAIFWAYPAALGCFCLISARLAAILSGATILIITALLYQQISNEELIRIFATLCILFFFGYIFNNSIHLQRKQLSALAARDALTGTWNRRTLDETLIQTTSSNNRNPLTASLIILDLDHFKHINDTYGHNAGDRVLVKVAETIRDSIRLSDRLFRYGGEEFIILADGATLDNAAILAETIRKKVEKNCGFKKETITISLGVASLKDGQDPETWMRLADQALYEAKRTGRNKFCLAKGPIAAAA